MKVLFVDDEPQILKGITRMLECADVDWDIDTAASGDEALQQMQAEPADVIISDMKMPGMDGAELLSKVSELYPATVRIVLSGQADKEAVYRAVSPMHQYLSKPCEAEKLRDTITRSCSLRSVLDITSSHEILGRITSLPSLPEVYQKVVEEVDSEDGSIAKVGEHVSKDPAMTAKVLQLANSAIFGRRVNVTSAAQAASLIGMDALKSLILSLSVFRSFEDAGIECFNLEEMAEHSLQVGSLGRRIAQAEGLSNEIASEAFTSGLLHDVGKLILASYANDQFAIAIARASSESISLADAESQLLGIRHDEIGGYLLALWGLPQSIVEGVAFHHSPKRCESGELTTPAIVYIANHLVMDLDDPQDQTRFDDFIRELGLVDRVAAWSEHAVQPERNGS